MTSVRASTWKAWAAARQLSEAFTLNPGQVSGVISVGTNQVLFKVVSHTPANEADFAAQRDQIREELLDQKRDLQFEIYRQNLKDQFIRSGKLKINDAGMKTVPGFLRGAVGSKGARYQVPVGSVKPAEVLRATDVPGFDAMRQ